MAEPDVNLGLALSASALDISLGRKHKRRILEGVSFELPFATVCAIAGPNGAGKSTLLRALLGLIPSDAGRVECEGRLIADMDRVERAQKIAYVPQRSLLDAGLQVEEVIAHGRFAQSESRIKTLDAVARAMEQAGISDLRGRNYLELSGGEKRLCMIARALSTEARIICLDEPTASLDIANRLRILSLLRELATGGHAVLCVLHELEDARRFSDQILLLDQGSVVARGAPEEVIRPDMIRNVYRVEVRDNDAMGFHLRSEPQR